MFTNVRHPLSWRFPQEALPGALKNAPLFLLDNPLALQNRTMNHPNKRGIVKSCEQRALEMLVNLFDWLDGLEPQPATEIVSLYKKYKEIEAKTIKTLAQADQAAATKAETDERIVRLRKSSAVKDEKEKTTALIAINEIVLHKLNQAIDGAPSDLAQLVEDYGRFSLSGSFLEQLGSTIRLLEQRYKDMENSGMGPLHLQEKKKSLDDVKRKLEFLNSAKENAQKSLLG